MQVSEPDETVVAEVASLLRQHGQTVSTAESCSGGLIAKMLTDIPGSSHYFKEGIVAYSNEAKVRLLGVAEGLIEQHGAVSKQVAVAMAVGCRVNSRTDYAISVTGIAGPSGGTVDKPVGLVYIGLADSTGCEVKELRLGEHLTRDEIRHQSATGAMRQLLARLRAI